MKIVDYIAALIIFPAIYISTISILKIGAGFTAISLADPSESHNVASQMMEPVVSSQSVLILYLVPSLLLCSYVSLKQKNDQPLYRWSLILSSFGLLISVPILSVVGGYLLWLGLKAKSKH